LLAAGGTRGLEPSEEEGELRWSQVDSSPDPGSHEELAPTERKGVVKGLRVDADDEGGGDGGGGERPILVLRVIYSGRRENKAAGHRPLNDPEHACANALQALT
jgi:hypothetical protein